MKKIFLLLVMIGCFFIGCSESNKKEEIKSVTQDSLKNITKLQKFFSQKGILIIKDYYSLGDLSEKTTILGHSYIAREMKFVAIVLYEPGKEEQRIKGLSIEITDYERSKISETSFLDLEELESLSNAIKYMSKLNEDWKDKSNEYTEVIFETKGNFRVGFAKRKDVINVFASCGYINRVNCFFNAADEFLAIKNKIDEGIALLKGK